MKRSRRYCPITENPHVAKCLQAFNECDRESIQRVLANDNTRHHLFYILNYRTRYELTSPTC
jgi:hypothetical protein